MTLATGAGRTSSRGIPAGPQLGLVLVLAVWYAVVYALTANGWISLDVLLFGKLPTLLAAIAAPTAVGILLLYFTGFRKLIDGVPVSLLAAFHGLRIPFGFVFLAVYELGEIPWEFASRGGYGDITAGLLGLLVAYLYFNKANRTFARAAALLWIVQGLGDFVLVVYTAINYIPADAPFRDFYPFNLIPAFVVPMFILTHLYALRAIMRKRD